MFMLRYIQIGNNSFIPTFNLLVGIGIALGMLFLQYNKDFKNKSDKYIQSIHFGLLLAILIGFVGAFTFDAYTQGISLTFSNLNQIGLTFFGGFLTGLLIFVIYLKIFSQPILETLNLLTPSFCIAHFFGRVACFFAGCCFGKPTNSIFGIKFPVDSLPYNHYHKQMNIHPTQLYESAFVLILFSYLFLSKSKNKFFIYLFSYSIFRFFIEFIRADNRGELFNQNAFTPSQFISIFSATTILFLMTTRKFFQSQTIKF